MHMFGSTKDIQLTPALLHKDIVTTQRYRNGQHGGRFLGSVGPSLIFMDDTMRRPTDNNFKMIFLRESILDVWISSQGHWTLIHLGGSKKSHFLMIPSPDASGLKVRSDHRHGRSIFFRLLKCGDLSVVLSEECPYRRKFLTYLS